MRRSISFAVLFLAPALAPAACSSATPAPPSVTCPAAPLTPAAHGLSLTGYHGGPARTGWNDAEPGLSPANAAHLALSWCTPAFAAASVGGTSYPAHLYASPLFADDVALTAPPYAGARTSVVLAATSNGDVYAVAAADGVASSGAALATGAIAWRAHLTEPAEPEGSSDGVPLGVLGTPVLDLAASPPRVYVTSMDAARGWLAFALDLGSGATLPGWPVALDATSIMAVNANADPARPATFADARTLSQRGGLNLDASGALLYAGFGSYADTAVGWMVAIDTRAPRVAASFSGAPSDVAAPAGADGAASAGMWGAGGAVVAPDGKVLVTTGNSPKDSAAARGVWGDSVLAWSPPLALAATYTPWNYCTLDEGDVDLGGSSPIAFDLPAGETSTPHLAAFGSKQGDVYLVDRDALGGKLDARPPCDVAHLPSPTTDTSLYGPDMRAYYTPPSRGPLSVFGPYSDAPGANEANNAKMRTAPALYRTAAGDTFLFVSGNSRSADLSKVTAPSLARLRVVTAPGAPAYLAPDGVAADVVFSNPGPPVVTSDHSSGPIVWVLDENGKRTDPLVPGPGYSPPLPVLYAFDGLTLALLWRGSLPATGGKYGHATIAHGAAYVGGDRIFAYRAAP